MTRTAHRAAGLGLLLAFEAFLFSRSFGMFFGGDSLYYFSRLVTSGSDLVRVLTHVDYVEEYRPLPFVLFSWVLHPLFGLEPTGYHVVPVLFHLANTLLVFVLARRLLDSDLGAGVAAFFFGTHSVGFFITYDTTMMTEFLYVFFFLAASLAALDHVETGRPARMGLALAAFAAALLAKEAAITLVATVPMAATVRLAARRPDEPLLRTCARALRAAWPLLALAALYLVFLLAIKDWHLFPSRPGHPHHARFTLATLAGKLRYLAWTINLPDQLVLKKAALPQLAIATALAPFAAALAIWTAWGAAARKPIVLCGALWFLATLSPVLFLPNLTQEHYLYLPLAGAGLLFGSLAEALARRARAWRLPVPAGAAVLALFAAANAAASWHNATGYLRDSWLTNGSRIASASLESLRAARPTLPEGTLLHFLPSSEKDLPWYYDSGRMFNVFYGTSTVRAQFADRGAPFPAEALAQGRAVILRFIRPRLYDATAEVAAELGETGSVKLLPAFAAENIAFDRREGCYPSYQTFETPTGRPVFRMAVGRGATGREALVLVAGARVRFDLGPLAAGSRLAFGLAMPFDQGDGAEARIYFEEEGDTALLFGRWLRPGRIESDRRWRDQTLDLARFAGRKGRIVLECNSGPDLDVIGDWVAFSGLRILPAPAAPAAPESEPANPAWLHVTPAFARRGEPVVISVGNGAGMTIDCRYTVDGAARLRQAWFTADAAGRYVFKPDEPGRWEIVTIKNARARDWIESPAYLVVQ